MKNFIFILLMTLAGGNIGAAELQACTKQLDCNDDEICVSYTDCKGHQIKRCLARSCYRSGVNCPSDLVCNDKHCSALGCKS